MTHDNLIDGKAIAAEVRAELAGHARVFAESRGRSVGLAVVLVGEDPASQVYVRNKERAAAEAGIAGVVHRLPHDTTQAALLALVHALSADDAVDGILVQLPLPKHLAPAPVIAAIAPEKDVDGLHPINQGHLLAGVAGLRPCTPLGCMHLLARSGVVLAGKRAVVLGRSSLVGKPMALLLLDAHATVTLCHSRTADLAAEVARADVLVAAIGQPGFVRGEWVREGAAVLDVGTSRLPDGRLSGDVEFDAAALRAGLITPVPGGVGPMTVAMLLHNAVTAACARAGLAPPRLRAMPPPS